MSLADVTFINMCRDVIENGTSTEGEKVRSSLGRRYIGLHDQEIWSSESL